MSTEPEKYSLPEMIDFAKKQLKEIAALELTKYLEKGISVIEVSSGKLTVLYKPTTKND